MYRKKGTKEMKFAMRNSQRFNAINAVPITQYCLFALTFLVFTYEVRGGRISIDDQVALEKM